MRNPQDVRDLHQRILIALLGILLCFMLIRIDQLSRTANSIADALDRAFPEPAEQEPR